MLKPNQLWDGSVGHKFVIHGRSNLDYVTNTDDRHSISGGRVYLPVRMSSHFSQSDTEVCDLVGYIGRQKEQRE